MISGDIGIIFSIIGLGISAIGLVVSILAKGKAQNTNKIFQAGVDKAEESNRKIFIASIPQRLFYLKVLKNI